MASRLPFWHSPHPCKDFLVFVYKKRFFTKAKKSAADKGLASVSFEQTPFVEGGGAYNSLLCASKASKTLLSGWLAIDGRMYLGQDEIPPELLRTEVLDKADGYFTFALSDGDRAVVSQDIFGKDMLCCCFSENFALISNRYHLLLLYLKWLGETPRINHDNVLCMMCSEDGTFAHQNVTRNLLFQGHRLLYPSERIVIDAGGWNVEQKPCYANVWQEKNEAETKRLFEQAVEEIRANGRAVFSGTWPDGIKTEVTGGYDSRISTAAVLSTGNRDFDVKTVVNKQSIGDQTVSELICRKFGLRRGSPNYYPREQFASYGDAVNFVRSYFMGVFFQGVLTRSYVSPDALSLRVGGDFGELYKGYYVKRYLPELASERVSTRRLADEFVKKVRFTITDAELHKRIANALFDDMDGFPALTAQEKFNMHLNFFRLRFHFGNPAAQRGGSGFAWAPATSLAALSYCYATPYFERYKTHPYEINVRLAHAVCPELSDIPFTSGGVGLINYVLFSENGYADVTDAYRNTDVSAWTEVLKRAAGGHVASIPNASEVAREFSAKTDLTYMLNETLMYFDRLRTMDEGLAETLSPGLREHIANRGMAQSVIDYHSRLRQLVDMLEIFDEVPALQAVEADDRVKRTDYVSDVAICPIRVAQDENALINKGLLLLPSGKTVLINTSESRSTIWQDGFSDDDKVYLFSFDWLRNLLIDGNARNRAKWLFCQDMLQGYYSYLIWGGMNFFETRQSLPHHTLEMYVSRILIVARIINLSPPNWFFYPNACRILWQSGDHISKNMGDDSPCDRKIAMLGLIYAANLLAAHPKYAVSATRWRAMYSKDPLLQPSDSESDFEA